MLIHCMNSEVSDAGSAYGRGVPMSDAAYGVVCPLP